MKKVLTFFAHKKEEEVGRNGADDKGRLNFNYFHKEPLARSLLATF